MRSPSPGRAAGYKSPSRRLSRSAPAKRRSGSSEVPHEARHRVEKKQGGAGKSIVLATALELRLGYPSSTADLTILLITICRVDPFLIPASASLRSARFVHLGCAAYQHADDYGITVSY